MLRTLNFSRRTLHLCITVEKNSPTQRLYSITQLSPNRHAHMSTKTHTPNITNNLLCRSSDVSKVTQQPLTVRCSAGYLCFAHHRLSTLLCFNQYRSLSDNSKTSGKIEDRSSAQPNSSNGTEPKENIYTIPNFLTVGRFIVAPYLGYMVLQENFHLACALLGVAALTDMADGYIARHWKGQSSILGSVIDPLADKFLVFNLVISLTWVQLIPVWLTALYLARDTYLVLNGFKVRYVTLPPPRTFKRYWDFSHPTAVVKPSMISKVNTNLQLVLLTATCAAPVFGYVDHIILQSLWGITAVTTVWSFADYIRNVPYTPIDQNNNGASSNDNHEKQVDQKD